jgi:hypothetical protein
VKPNDLGVAFKNSAFLLAEVMPRTADKPPSERIFLHVCELYRRIGCAGLLMGADPRPFYVCLSRSSRAFAHFYAVAPEGGKTLGKAVPLFDAIACRDLDGARMIAQRAPLAHNPAREYEEDFLYLRLICERFLLEGSRPVIEGMLGRYAELASEAPDVRLELCRAWVAGDQKGFDAALEEAIAAKVASIAKREDEDKLDSDEGPTTARISTEVLAWLEFAERAGLSVAKDYPLAPGVARLFHRAQPVHPDSWRNLTTLMDDLA